MTRLFSSFVSEPFCACLGTDHVTVSRTASDHDHQRLILNLLAMTIKFVFNSKSRLAGSSLELLRSESFETHTRIGGVGLRFVFTPSKTASGWDG